MFDLKNVERQKNIFSQVGEHLYRERFGQHHIDLRPRDLIRWIELCRDDLGYLTLVDMAAVDRRNNKVKWDCELEVVYVLFNMENHQRVHLHVHLNLSETLPSIVGYFVHADWMEREQAEMIGLSGKRPALLLAALEKTYPLRKDARLGQWSPHVPERLPELRVNPNKSEPPYEEEAWKWKSFDIFSPETSGNFEWQVCFDPVRVVAARSTVGFHHRGFEKLLEGKGWEHVTQLVDLLQEGAAPTYSTAWVKSLEEALRIKLPERAQAIRIVLLELARVAEHLTVLYEMAWALRKDEHRLFLNAREKVYELFEKYCGHRQGFGAVALGGVREDLPHGWIAEYQSIAANLQKNLGIIHKSLVGQNDFRSRLDASGVNAQTVLQWGVGGPAMRASGLNFDLRKSQPFYFYQDVDFDVPVGIHGTAYDRYLIRYEEIHQALRIITQVLDNLPLGEVMNAKDKDIAKAPGPALANLWHYSALEAPSGEAGFLFLGGEDSSAYRLKIKSPSFTLVQALPYFVQGLEEGQLRVAVASLGIRKSELDR